MIKAVVFDVDGVLIDSFAANLKFFQNLLIAAGYPPVTQEQYRHLFHLTMLDVIKMFAVGASEERIQEIWEMGKAKQSSLYPTEMVSSPPSLYEVLEGLSKDYALGIVTSRVRGKVFIFPSLKQTEKYFSTVIYFEDTEKHKPDPEPLFLCAQKMNLDPSEMVYVGDAATDIQAARAAGMKIIEYSSNTTTVADGITSDFSQIPQVVKEVANI